MIKISVCNENPKYKYFLLAFNNFMRVSKR